MLECFMRSIVSLSFLLFRRPPIFPLFPYTTLFRSLRVRDDIHLSMFRFSRTHAQESSCASCVSNRAHYYIIRSEEHTSELQSLRHLVCRLLLEKKKNKV